MIVLKEGRLNSQIEKVPVSLMETDIKLNITVGLSLYELTLSLKRTNNF